MAVAGTCPRCGTPSVANARFCSSCGAALPATAPEPSGWRSPQASGAPAPGSNAGPVASTPGQRRPLRAVTWVLAVIAVVGLAILAAQGSLNLPGISRGAGGTDAVIVTYHVTGSATGANITYTDGSGNIQQQTGLAVPLRPSSGGGDGLQIRSHHGAYVSILAQNTGTSGDLTCSIEADGRSSTLVTRPAATRSPHARPRFRSRPTCERRGKYGGSCS